jgi:hypothetical protein
MENPLRLSSVSPVPGGSDPGSSRKKLEESCRQFEGFFMAELMKKSNTVSTASPGEDKQAFDPLEETALEMSARSISEEGEGLGLWRVLYNDLCRSLPEERPVPAGEEDDA